MQDVIIIGGGYAGMAAALQLLRARRQVLVIDAGQRRNRFARTSHGFLGQDGVDAATIASVAREQLMAYPTLTWIDGLATAASGHKDDFRVTVPSGEEYSARRLLFATGVADELPPIPGLAERWGTSVFHCPYCHGYELDQGAIGVIASGPMSAHQAQLLPDWGPTTYLNYASMPLADDTRQNLLNRGVTIEDTLIDKIEGEADVLLTDGRRLPFAGLFIISRCTPASPLAGAMGCTLMDTPLGTQIQTSDGKETSIPGVFACGDVARIPHSVSLAVGDGAWAGAQLHGSLVWPDS